MLRVQLQEQLLNVYKRVPLTLRLSKAYKKACAAPKKNKELTFNEKIDAFLRRTMKNRIIHNKGDKMSKSNQNTCPDYFGICGKSWVR